MLKPLSLYIGLRYIRAKRRNHFISFISLASMLGIALGVAVLITVLSVMNGFNHQVRKKIFAIMPEVTIMTNSNIAQSWPGLRENLLKMPQVRAASPYVNGKGMLINAGQVSGVEALGIDPKLETTTSMISEKIVAGSLDSLQPGKFNMVISRSLADSLELNVGDKVNLLTPQATITLAGMFPRYKAFTISGIYHVSSGFGFVGIVYINLQDAEKLFPPGQGFSGLHLKLVNPYDAVNVTNQLMDQLPVTYSVNNWTIQFGAYFEALVMEKTILFVILFLIVAVAVFNLVSSLVMVVNDKRADIAILKTLGASPRTIMATFIIQGAMVGLIGTVIGIVCGVILALNAPAIVSWVQNQLGVQLISSSVFILNYLPSELQASDVVMVSLIAIFLSLLATLYPAWIAFRTQPAEALRYE